MHLSNLASFVELKWHWIPVLLLVEVYVASVKAKPVTVVDNIFR